MTASISCSPLQHAALQFEIGEAVVIVGGFGQPHDSFRRHRFLMPQSEPVDLLVFARGIGEVGLVAVADVEEIAERLDAGALLAFAEQRRDGKVQMLAEQIEQRRFDRGHRVDRDAEIEGLLAAATGIAIGEFAAHRRQDVVAGADGLADDEFAGVLQRLADLFAARHLADTGMAGIVGQDHQIAGEERRMRAAQIEQHAVAAGDRDHLHGGDHRCARKSSADRFLDHLLLPFCFAIACGPILRLAATRCQPAVCSPAL